MNKSNTRLVWLALLISSSAFSQSPISITTRTGPDGEYLTTADGKTLYVSDGDTKNNTGCTGDCAKQYPLLALESGQECKATGSVLSFILESLQLSDPYKTAYSTSIACGNAMVNSVNSPSGPTVFVDVPFHTSLDDHSPGDTNGKCKKVGNSTFYLVKPNGMIISCSANASPTPTPPPAAPAPPPTVPYPVPYPVPAPAGGGGSCGSYNVCGWTPGWRCYDPSPTLSQCRPECCSYTGDTSCPGSNACGGGGGSSGGGNSGGGSSGCGTFNVCGWTPGWRCNSTSSSSPPVGYRPECCYNANDSSCPGY